MKVDWIIVMAGAVGVVGAMEWIKGFFPLVKTWMTRIILLPVCFGVALITDGGWAQVGINAILMLAICQIGYDMILSNIKKLVESKIEK